MRDFEPTELSISLSEDLINELELEEQMDEATDIRMWSKL
jgi:hypothetical protein